MLCFGISRFGSLWRFSLIAPLVVPLDPASQLLPVYQQDDHRRLRTHLFQVVELLGVGLLGRGVLAPHGSRRAVLVEIGQPWANEFSVCHSHVLALSEPLFFVGGFW